MDYLTLPPLYTLTPPIHFRKIGMTTKNSGGFIRSRPTPLFRGGMIPCSYLQLDHCVCFLFLSKIQQHLFVFHDDSHYLFDPFPWRCFFQGINDVYARWCQINFQRIFYFNICVTDHLDILLYWSSMCRFPQRLWPIYSSWTLSSRVDVYQTMAHMISCIVFTWHIPPLID